jgi:hypothetical protein
MATEKNLQGTDPAAPAGARNNIWQLDPVAGGTDANSGQPYYNASCYMTDMVGDAGSGGADGLVPAPAAGDGAAKKFLRADGTWALPSSAIVIVALAPSVGGNFTVAHGIGHTPTAALIQMTSAGVIWFQAPTSYDATNLYLTASDGPLTGNAIVFP